MKTKAIIFLLLSIFIFSAAENFAIASEVVKTVDLMQTGDDKFDKSFREGRELIDKEDWKKAAEKFSQIICDCPEKKGVDAAFYWLAFSYKKQKMYAEMNQAIDRLLKNFPNSSWADDARVLRVQTISFNSKNSARNIFGSSPTTDYTASITKLEQDHSNAELVMQNQFFQMQSTALEREDEIKLAAFQSLFSSDAKRAIEILGERLSPDSGTNENLQVQMLRTVRNAIGLRPYFVRGVMTPTATTLFSTNSVTTTTTTTKNNPTESRDALNPQLREVLTRGYKNSTSVKVKSEILYFFGSSEESSAFLAQMYLSENDKLLKRTIIRALSGVGLSPLYQAMNSNTLRKENFNKILEIYKSEKDTELKIAALFALQSFKGWSQNEAFISTVLQSYDSETDEKLKISIINLLGEINSAQATAKLLEIAKNDKSGKMRLEAIRALRGNKSPQVIKFLEDLIK